MATACPAGFDVQEFRDTVYATYDLVARNPECPMHFNVGADYAVNLLRYDRSELDDLPKRASARFAGVGNPHRIGPVHPGETVVDVGSGGGLDLLIAADRVGPTGRAIGIDPTAAMREAAMASVIDAGLASRIRILEGTSEDIPLPDASVEVVISNGVLNLAVDKRKAIQEICRVLVPGGRLHLADVFLDKDLKESERLDAKLWAGCVAGALLEADILDIANDAGFQNCRIVERFECFLGSRVEKTVSPTVGVHGANFFAQKSDRIKKGTNMNPNKALWEKGDFTEIASLMRQSGEAVVKSLGISTPIRVLDLGCGDGTTAVPLARSGSEVIGIDIAQNLVAAGNKRAAALGLTRLTFQEGDASDLQGVADHSFDLTLTVFGAMFAPRPFDVAREMVRVTKPGGRIVMGNWIPNDPTSFVSQLLKISSSYMPPPPEGFVSPMTWGTDSHIIERFGQAGVSKDKISMVRDTYLFISPDHGPAQVIDSFRRFYGPTMNAYEAAEKTGRVEELHQQLLELATAQNKSTNGGTSIPATFLRVTVSV
jgi:ubiquinone/menaquinone biosynthesis C-methylase UbiE